MGIIDRLKHTLNQAGKKVELQSVYLLLSPYPLSSTSLPSTIQLLLGN